MLSYSIASSKCRDKILLLCLFSETTEEVDYGEFPVWHHKSILISLNSLQCCPNLILVHFVKNLYILLLTHKSFISCVFTILLSSSSQEIVLHKSPCRIVDTFLFLYVLNKQDMMC